MRWSQGFADGALTESRSSSAQGALGRAAEVVDIFRPSENRPQAVDTDPGQAADDGGREAAVNP